MNKETEFIEAIRECKKLAQETVRRVSDYADGVHAASTGDIQTNSGGVDELGTMVSDLVTSVDDLASVISKLDERVSTLEGVK